MGVGLQRDKREVPLGIPNIGPLDRTKDKLSIDKIPR